MVRLAGWLGQALRAILVLAIGVALVVAVFVAWWLALLLAFGFIAVWKLRRWFSGGKAAPGPGRGSAPVVIDGEFAVERDEAARMPRATVIDGEARREPAAEERVDR